jgi:hypothetical protein
MEFCFEADVERAYYEWDDDYPQLEEDSKNDNENRGRVTSKYLPTLPPRQQWMAISQSYGNPVANTLKVGDAIWCTIDQKGVVRKTERVWPGDGSHLQDKVWFTVNIHW